MSETLGLKNINMLSKEQYNGVAEPTNEELWAVSGLGVGFPSNRYDDLTLGASGTKYTAPANGYYFIDKTSTAASQYIQFYSTNSVRSRMERSVAASNDMELTYQVKKGEIVQIEYSLGGATNRFRFIYAEGEE